MQTIKINFNESIQVMSGRRAKDVCFYIPFVYGSQAIPLSAKEKSEAPENHTHRWTVFVRGVNGEDLSFMLRRVTFRLHDTYDNNNRSVEKYPFEVTETGWGEFEIVIKLLFTLACNEKLITLYHNLRLYPLDDVSNTTWSRGKVVHSFHYDELVFNEPYEAFYQTYLKQPTITLPAKKTPAQPYSEQAEQEEFEKLAKVKEKLKAKIHQNLIKIRNLKLSQHSRK